MKTPVLIGTSYLLLVSSRRATSSAQWPEAQRAAHRMSARSPVNSAVDDDARDHRADRDAGVRIGGVGHRFRFGHEPACAVALADDWDRDRPPHRGYRRRDDPWAAGAARSAGCARAALCRRSM